MIVGGLSVPWVQELGSVGWQEGLLLQARLCLKALAYSKHFGLDSWLLGFSTFACD